MMQINRASVLIAGSRTTSFLCNENQEIFECISERNYFELADFQAFNDVKLRKKIDNEENNYSEKSMKVDYQIRKFTEIEQLPKKRNLHDKETFSKKFKSSAEVEERFYGKASCSTLQTFSQASDDLNQNKVETCETHRQIFFRKIEKYLQKEPLSPELKSLLLSVICYTEALLYVPKSGDKTLLTNMIFEILRKSPLQPMFRENGFQLLQEFQSHRPLCEEIINDLIKDLISLSALASDNACDRLKLIDDILFLLHFLKELLEILTEINKDLNDRSIDDNSKYTEWKESNNISRLKNYQHKNIYKWKRRLEKVEKTNYVQILFMAGKCIELLNILSEQKHQQ